MMNKKERKIKKKKKKILDKVLMGAVIGGAIGSVVGASFAPKKGKETRQEITEMAKNAKKRGNKFFKKVKGAIKKDKHKESEEKPKKIPHEHV